MLQKVLKLQKPQKMEEAKLADRKQALKQQEERVRAKKQELKLKKELWISPSDVWKSQGLELIMLQYEKEVGCKKAGVEVGERMQCRTEHECFCLFMFWCLHP